MRAYPSRPGIRRSRLLERYSVGTVLRTVADLKVTRIHRAVLTLYL